MSADRYELIDFGDGRKLESLAGYVVDRPSPAAEQSRRSIPQAWNQTGSVYDADQRRWIHHQPWPEDLSIDCGSFRMPVRPTPHGHIGLFPEQAANWRWLASERTSDASPRDALNLFGYTGASSLALVTAGYRVAHVDAAKPNVQSLRTATVANRMDDPPIRFLVDDAAKFTAREVRRGRRYHTIVLDPPAYGHDPRGRAWRLERDLWPLLDDCQKLLDPSSFRLLVTGHSPQVDHTDVVEYWRQTGFSDGMTIQQGRSKLIDQSGRPLDAGFYVRIKNRSGSC